MNMPNGLSCPATLNKLLVCTDGSAESQGAIAAAFNLAQACGSKIHLIQVVHSVFEYESWPGMIADRDQTVLNYLEAWKVEAPKLGVALETKMVFADTPYEGIIEEAKKIEPELIIMGRHGGGRLYRLAMGNVSARAISYSHVNVLVVPKEVSLDFRKIIVASDGSSSSQAAWEQALQLARRLGSELVVVPLVGEDLGIEMAEKIAVQLKAEAEAAGISLESLILQGSPAETIIQAAREKQADLIVMGALGFGGVKSLFMGSATEKVIAQAPCGVLIVKRILKT
jgi:nucleotide-binding universal stress UspA family protein